MRFIRANDYEDMSRIAADIIAEQITHKKDSVLGLATGSTPLLIYRNLIRLYEEKKLDFSEVTSFNLDEYIGLDGENNQSYRYYMDHNLFDHVNIHKEMTYVPDGTAQSYDEECARYDRLLQEKGPVNLQLLGIGNNGHIGFNEPSDEFSKGTHIVELAKSTIEANSRFFDSYSDVPDKAVTMGTGSIMNAEKILLVACGQSKARAIKEAFFGEVTPEVPASILQLHKDVVIVGDKEALSEITATAAMKETV